MLAVIMGVSVNKLSDRCCPHQTGNSQPSWCRRTEYPKDREHFGSFYSRFATMPLSLVLRGPIREHAHSVLVYTDRFPGQCNRELTEKAIKIACRAELPSGFPFHIYHHASASNLWLQIADYCAYAIARKWEKGDLSLYTLLQRHLAKGEADVLRAEPTEYY